MQGAVLPDNKGEKGTPNAENSPGQRDRNLSGLGRL